MEQYKMIHLPYGRGSVTFRWPQMKEIDRIVYRKSDASCENEAEIIEKALNHPIYSPRLESLLKPEMKVVILVSDLSRLAPTHRFLPYLIKRVEQSGIRKEQITIVVALGVHRKHASSELEQLVGSKIYRNYHVVNHSALEEDCVFLGNTSQGTPICINRTVVEADFVIATGGIEPHRLAGMSGGVKALFPGTASLKSIEANHKLSLSHNIEPGTTTNPIHDDFAQVLKFKRIDFLFNVIVDHKRNILDAVAGHCIHAHTIGAKKARQRFMVPTPKTYDSVIVSPGGAPKDLQMYQAIKAIQNAAEIVAEGGTILCVAQCPEQYGCSRLHQMVEQYETLEEMVNEVHKRFVVGAHKVDTIYHILQKRRVLFYSSMPDVLVERLGFIPVQELQQTVNSLIHSYPNGTFAYMPFGSITFSVSSFIPHKPALMS